MLLNEDPNPRSVREKHDDDEHWLRSRRHHRILSGLCALLALAVAGAIWYAYPILNRHDLSLVQLSHTQQALNRIDGSLEQQQSKVAEWSNDQQQVRDQVTKLGRDIRVRIETMRKQTGQAAEDLFHRVQAEIASQIEGVKTRVAKLESSREADKTQIAALQQELGQVRSELGEQTQELSDVRRRMEDGAAGTERRLAGLQANEERDRQGVDAINNRLTVHRIDFEVTKGHSRELAPGISLEITGTDVAFRRVSGWMWVLPDRRTIWLRQQGAQEPVDFYGYTDGKKRELVITSVTKGSVAGYLLLPKEANAGQSASAPADSATSIAAASE